MLGRAEKCSAEKKNSSAEQQCAYKRSYCIVLVGHSKFNKIFPLLEIEEPDFLQL